MTKGGTCYYTNNLAYCKCLDGYSGRRNIFINFNNFNLLLLYYEYEIGMWCQFGLIKPENIQQFTVCPKNNCLNGINKN